MTREEELDWLCRLRSEIYVYMPKEWLIPMNNALDMTIQALEQEPTEEGGYCCRTCKNTRINKDGIWCEKPTCQWEQAETNISEQEPKTEQYEKHIDHTDCIWYGNDSGCPVTCSQYRDGWNDAMDYIFKNGKGYQPYRHDG